MIRNIFPNKKANEWLVREGLQLPERYTNNSLVYDNNVTQKIQMSKKITTKKN